MPHVMAMTALGVPAGPQWVAPRYWHDPAVVRLRSRVECHVWEEANASIIEQILAGDFVNFPTRVVVHARGSSFEAEGLFAMGDHDLPETRYGDEEVVAKFRSYTDQALASVNVERCIETVMTLDKVRHVAELVGFIY